MNEPTTQVQPTNTLQLTRLNRDEWVEVLKTARSRFLVEIMGERPKRADIDKELPNSFPISPLAKAAFVLLIFIGIFTGLKMWAISGDFADYYFHGALANATVKGVFQASAAAVFILSSTSGLIYFKLQTEAKEVLELQALHPMTAKNFLSINVFSHRLYPLLTYLVAIWLFVTSAYGTTWDNFGASIFTRYLPVIMEIALASLVADMLKRVELRNAEVFTVWKLRCEDYDKRVKGMETDKAYLHILFEQMRDTLTRLKRNGKPVNSWLEIANGEIVKNAMKHEYNRLKKAGLDFADELTNESQTTDYASMERRAAADFVAENVAGTRTGRAPLVATKNPDKASRILPPHGAKRWTVETLIADFKRRGLQPDTEYTETMVNNDYEAGHGHRTAWRGGAKAYFKAV